MNLISTRIMAAVLSFTFGIISVVASAAYPRFENFLVDRLGPADAPQIQYDPLYYACDDGRPQDYEFPNHKYQVRGGVCFDSPELAIQQFQYLISKSSRIVERCLSSRNGFGVEGELVVLAFRVWDGGGEIEISYWYGGGKYYLYSIISSRPRRQCEAIEYWPGDPAYFTRIESKPKVN